MTIANISSAAPLSSLSALRNGDSTSPRTPLSRLSTVNPNSPAALATQNTVSASTNDVVTITRVGSQTTAGITHTAFTISSRPTSIDPDGSHNGPGFATETEGFSTTRAGSDNLISLESASVVTAPNVSAASLASPAPAAQNFSQAPIADASPAASANALFNSPSSSGALSVDGTVSPGAGSPGTAPATSASPASASASAEGGTVAAASLTSHFAAAVQPAVQITGTADVGASLSLYTAAGAASSSGNSTDQNVSDQSQSAAATTPPAAQSTSGYTALANLGASTIRGAGLNVVT